MCKHRRSTKFDRLDFGTDQDQDLGPEWFFLHFSNIERQGVLYIKYDHFDNFR